MAILFQSNFEGGTAGEWDSESDTGSLLDVVHYSSIASDPTNVMPYRGAYCLRNRLGDTNDHILTEGDIDIADAATRYVRFYMAVSSDFRATADDTFNIFELQQAGGTVEISCGMRVTASNQLIEIGIGDGTAPTSFVSWPAKRKWVCVELAVLISTGGTGTVTLYLDGAQAVALTSQTHAAAVGRGVLGTQDTLATTIGAIYFDEFGFADARLFPYRERFPTAFQLNKSGHLFIGPGNIEGATLNVISTGDETLSLYDTDTATISDENKIVELSSTAQTSVSGPLYFQRGCYAVIAGTSPRGTVYLMRNTDKRGSKGPRYQTPALMRHYAIARKARSLNA